MLEAKPWLTAGITTAQINAILAESARLQYLEMMNALRRPPPPPPPPLAPMEPPPPPKKPKPQKAGADAWLAAYAAANPRPDLARAYADYLVAMDGRGGRRMTRKSFERRLAKALK